MLRVGYVTTTQYWCDIMHDIMHNRPSRCVRVPRAQPPLHLAVSAPQQPPVRAHCSSHARPTSGPLWARYGSQAVAFVVPPPASGSGTGWETIESSGGRQPSWGAGGARGGVGALRSLGVPRAMRLVASLAMCLLFMVVGASSNLLGRARGHVCVRTWSASGSRETRVCSRKTP